MISFDDKPGVYADAPVGVHIDLHVGPRANTEKDSIRATSLCLTFYGVKFFFESQEQAENAAEGLYYAICEERGK